MMTIYRIALFYARFLCRYCHLTPASACARAANVFNLSGAELFQADRARWLWLMEEPGRAWISDGVEIEQALFAVAGEPWTGENVQVVQLGECAVGDAVRISTELPDELLAELPVDWLDDVGFDGWRAALICCRECGKGDVERGREAWANTWPADVNLADCPCPECGQVGGLEILEDSSESEANPS